LSLFLSLYDKKSKHSLNLAGHQIKLKQHPVQTMCIVWAKLTKPSFFMTESEHFSRSSLENQQTSLF
jgi:hypothetical protein